MTEKKGLDDPRIAAIAWSRFRRIMLWMALIGALCVGAALLFLLLGLWMIADLQGWIARP